MGNAAAERDEAADVGIWNSAGSWSSTRRARPSAGRIISTQARCLPPSADWRAVPDGRLKDITVSMPAHEFLCDKGDRATLVGDISPDDAEMPAVLTSPRLVSCKFTQSVR